MKIDKVAFYRLKNLQQNTSMGNGSTLNSVSIISTYQILVLSQLSYAIFLQRATLKTAYSITSECD